ncbi:MAG: cupin domain-containing protein [Arenimonas sp.]
MTPKHFVPFSTENAERTDYHVAAEKLIYGNTAQSTLNMFSDPGMEFHCGIWEGAPALWRVSYSEHEFCHILQGRIRIADEAGTSITVGPGDNFVIAAGFKGTWETLEQAKKIYVVFERCTPP